MCRVTAASTTVAGITTLQQRLMALPARWITAEHRASWVTFKPMLPELPVDDTQLLVAFRRLDAVKG